MNCPTTDFISNKFTWAASTQQFEEDLPAILLAVERSALPTRVVALSQIKLEDKTYSRTKITNLAIFKKGAINMTKPRPCCPTHISADKKPNDKTLALIIIENIEAPEFDRVAMEGELRREAVNELTIWSSKTALRKEDTTDTPKHHTRNNINKHSSLIWYRREHTLPTDKKQLEKLSRTEKYNRLKGSIGILPSSLKWDLYKLNHDIDKLTHGNLQQVAKIIRDTSLEAYRRSEHWKHRKRVTR